MSRVRFIVCNTEEFEKLQDKDDSCLYFIIGKGNAEYDLTGSLYKGSQLMGKDFTTELEALVVVIEALGEKVEELEKKPSGGSLEWRGFEQ